MTKILVVYYSMYGHVEIMIENLITAHRNRVRQACGGKTRAGVDHFTRIAIKSSLGVRDDDVRIRFETIE